MSEILICSAPTSPEILHSQCGIQGDELFCANATQPTMLDSYTPYLVGNEPTSNDKGIMTFLSPFYISKSISELSSVYGEDNTIALSEIFNTLSDNGIGSALLGASSGTYTKKIGMFSDSVNDYQRALLSYRDASRGGIGSKTLAKQRVQTTFQSMQQKFQFELMSNKVRGMSHRGTPLSNINRGMNIARSSRNTTKLNLSGQIETYRLVEFSKYAKVLGNGLIAYDFYNRSNLVKNSFDTDGDWERDFFVETSSFVTSTALGMLAADALTVMVFATPIGWIGLVIGGLAVVSATALVSISANNATKYSVGFLYDQIMNAMKF